MQYIPVLEYLQMAGRAGRPKFDSYGEAICISPSDIEKEKIEEKYIHGAPEEIYSKLAAEPVLRFYLLSLISTRFVKSKKEIMDFVSKTFWAYQFRDIERLEEIIDKMLELLERYEFIKTEEKEFTSAKDLFAGDESPIKPTMLGLRVAQLYIDPLTAHHIIKCIRRSTEKPASTFSMLQMVSNTLEMRPLLRVKTKEVDKINQMFLKYEGELLQKEPSIYEPDYDDFLASIKTAFFLNDWIDEKEEEFLLEEYDVRPGETRAKLDKADWLLYSAEELAKLMHFTEILAKIIKLRFRMKYGVKEELLPLLKFEGIGRVRARKLHNANIKDAGDVKKADISTLGYLVGNAVAASLKRQVGEDAEKIAVPEGRRKGQTSLMKYDG
jgi:helicase